MASIDLQTPTGVQPSPRFLALSSPRLALAAAAGSAAGWFTRVFPRGRKQETEAGSLRGDVCSLASQPGALAMRVGEAGFPAGLADAAAGLRAPPLSWPPSPLVGGAVGAAVDGEIDALEKVGWWAAPPRRRPVCWYALRQTTSRLTQSCAFEEVAIVTAAAVGDGGSKGCRWNEAIAEATRQVAYPTKLRAAAPQLGRRPILLK